MFVERLRSLVGGGSVRGFANIVGTSPNAMRTYLAGTSEPTLGMLRKIAAATGVSVAWLIGESDDRGQSLPPVVAEGLPKRLRHAWTGELPELLQRSGVSKPDFLDYITGNRIPDEDALRRLAKATQVSPAWLAAGLGRKQIIEAPEDLGMVVGNIKDLIKDTGGVWSFSQAVGVSTNHVQELVSDAACPSYSLLAEIARTCRRSLYWLLTGEDGPGGSAYQLQLQTQQLETREPEAERFEDRFALVPLYDVRVSAGHGAFNGTENVLTQLAFTRYWLNKLGLHAAHLAAVRVDGDSMEPTIRSGDVLLIDREQTHPRDGAIYVMRREDWLVAKRLQLLAGGLVRVISDNQAYPPEEVAPEALEILGRAVWKGGPL